MKNYIIIAGIMGAIAVILGAFGAHGLEGKLSEVQIATYKTGVQYHFYHTFAILACVCVGLIRPHRLFRSAALSFTIGIFLFSGSLYLLSCRELIGLSSWKWLGPLTPIGGLGFIIGWVLFTLGASKALKTE